MATKSTPIVPTKFWCNICDNEIVDSEKPETGSFYIQFGHTFNANTKHFDGAYVGVMYAICATCEKDAK